MGEEGVKKSGKLLKSYMDDPIYYVQILASSSKSFTVVIGKVGGNELWGGEAMCIEMGCLQTFLGGKMIQ